MSLNKVLVMGHLGKDPELKYSPQGVAICKFSVATNESWKDKSGVLQQKTEWHNTVVFGKLAEYCNQYLSKGSQVFIEGKLSTSSWTDKDGKKQYRTEIVISSIQQTGSRGKKDDSDNDNGELPEDFGFAPDDMPF